MIYSNNIVINKMKATQEKSATKPVFRGRSTDHPTCKDSFSPSTECWLRDNLQTAGCRQIRRHTLLLIERFTLSSQIPSLADSFISHVQRVQNRLHCKMWILRPLCATTPKNNKTAFGDQDPRRVYLKHILWITDEKYLESIAAEHLTPFTNLKGKNTSICKD